MNLITSFSKKNHIGLATKPLCGQRLDLPRPCVEVRFLKQVGYIEENWNGLWVKNVNEVNLCKKCSKAFKSENGQ